MQPNTLFSTLISTLVILILLLTGANQAWALTGDTNGDNVVDVFDLVLVGSYFGLAADPVDGTWTPPEAGQADVAPDPVGDDVINIFDLILVASNFGARAYTITATASSGGTIAPEGDVEVIQTADQTFTITPDTGYAIQDVLVDGSSVGSVSTYTFTNVTSDHNIDVQFNLSFPISSQFETGLIANQVSSMWYPVSFQQAFSDIPVVIAGILSANDSEDRNSWYDSDTVGLRISNLDAQKMEMSIEEDESLDTETVHASETVGYLALEPGIIEDINGNFIGECGSLQEWQDDDTQWHILEFNPAHSYADPIAFMNITSYGGSQPCHIRIRNVTPTSLEYQIEEWDYLDQGHASEEISYVIWEQGIHTLPDGRVTEVGQLQGNDTWRKIIIQHPYNSNVMVLSQSQTYNGNQAIITRQWHMPGQGSVVRLQEEEEHTDGHPSETIGYIILPVTEEDLSQYGVKINHHHIHDFGGNYENAWGKGEYGKDTYAHTHRHALQTGYSMVTRGTPGDSQYQALAVIKEHNAQSSPIRFRVKTYQDGTVLNEFSYHDRYHADYDPVESKYRCAPFIPQHIDKYVHVWYTVDQPVIDFIKGYGASRKDYPIPDLTLGNFSIATLKELFHGGWTETKTVTEYGQQVTIVSTNVIANMTSRTVVDDLVEQTKLTIQDEKLGGIFFDNFSANDILCGNGAYHNDPYSSWAEGQKDFVNRVVAYVRDPANPGVDRPFFVTANIGNPKTGAKIAEYYAEGSIQLDHYYYEQGTVRDPYTREEIITMDANAKIGNQLVYIPIDPDTLIHIYPNTQDAYIPADRLSTDTEQGWYVSPFIGEVTYREDDYPELVAPPEDDYFTQHLKACGIAGKQGTWFGYYGTDSLAKRDYFYYDQLAQQPVLKTDWDQRELVYTNDLQLLRTIPNWDNLLDIPIPDYDPAVGYYPSPTDERQWYEGSLTYSSPNSYASPDVIYSRHFHTGELFVVFKTLNGVVQLNPGETIKTAEFVNKYFEKSGEDAQGALVISRDEISFNPDPAYSDKLGIGIRIVLQ